MTLVEILKQYRRILLQQIASTEGVLAGWLTVTARRRVQYAQDKRIATVTAIDVELARMQRDVLSDGFSKA